MLRSYIDITLHILPLSSCWSVIAALFIYMFHSFMTLGQNEIAFFFSYLSQLLTSLLLLLNMLMTHPDFHALCLKSFSALRY